MVVHVLNWLFYNLKCSWLFIILKFYWLSMKFNDFFLPQIFLIAEAANLRREYFYSNCDYHITFIINVAE